jgi:hypothetical protein
VVEPSGEAGGDPPRRITDFNLTLQKPALTIVEWALLAIPRCRSPASALEEFAKAGIAYDKHPEAGQ